MKKIRSFSAAPLAIALSLFSALSAEAKTPSYALTAEPFPVQTVTEIPGHILKPGAYTIRIVDDFKDRFILRVDDPSGKPQATFIGLHNAQFAPFVALHQQGPIFWTASPHGKTAVRAFSFPGGNTLEFVYPKGEAVALAKLNTNSVPAIDPESEGRKADPNLSPEDREVVTLWMLTATRVGPKQQTPAIEAKRFVASTESSPNPTEQQARATSNLTSAGDATTQIARNDPPPVPPRVSGPPSRIHAKVARLPQTASQFPLLLLISVLLSGAALGMRLRRLTA